MQFQLSDIAFNKKFSTKEAMLAYYLDNKLAKEYEVIANSNNTEFILIPRNFDAELKSFEEELNRGKPVAPNGELTRTINTLRMVNRDYLFSMLPRVKSGRFLMTPNLYVMWGRSKGEYPYFSLNKCCGIKFEAITCYYYDDEHDRLQSHRFDNMYKVSLTIGDTKSGETTRLKPPVLIDSNFKLVNMNIMLAQRPKKLKLEDLVPGCRYKTKTNKDYIYLGMCTYKRKRYELGYGNPPRTCNEVDEISEVSTPLLLRIYKKSSGADECDGKTLADYVKYAIENHTQPMTFDDKIDLREMKDTTFMGEKFSLVDVQCKHSVVYNYHYDYYFITNQ